MSVEQSPLAELDDNALTAEFLRAWEAFRRLLTEFSERLAAETALSGWAWHSAAPHQAAADIVAKMFYDDDQPSREVRIQPGLIGAGEQTIRLAHGTNARRARVKRALMALDRRSHVAVNPATGRKRRSRLGDVVLQRHGLARLHRVQLYREVRVLPSRPDMVGFVWAHTRRVARISVAELREQVRRLLRNPPQAPFARTDLDHLANLRDDESLALVEAQPLHVRANVAWRKPDGSGYMRRMTAATLPLLYPAQEHESLPRIKPLPDQPTAQPRRSARTDRKLQPEPFLQTLPAYRYRRDEGAP